MINVYFRQIFGIFKNTSNHHKWKEKDPYVVVGKLPVVLDLRHSVSDNI
jgi:hypothetical protein